MTQPSTFPPLEGIAALVAAAEQGSFTAAADVLGLTHGSVSRRISVLEAWLGTAVFERHGRGVSLTPAGRRFLAEARQALGILGESAERWRPRPGRATVRLSVVPSFARLWLLPRLTRLEREDLRIEVLAEHRPADLAAREADISLRYGGGHWEGVDARLLMTERLAPAASPSLAIKADSFGSLGLEGMPPLLHDSDSSQWRAWFAAGGVKYRPRWQDRRFEDYDTVLAAARAGLGVVLARLPLVQEAIDRNELVLVAARGMVNPKSHYVCRRTGEAREAVNRLADRILGEAPG